MVYDVKHAFPFITDAEFPKGFISAHSFSHSVGCLHPMIKFLHIAQV